MRLNPSQAITDIAQPMLNDGRALVWREFGYWYWFSVGASAARSK